MTHATLLTAAAVVFALSAAAPAMNFTPLCPVQTVTSGPYHHTHAYPTARTWNRDSVFSQDGKKIAFSLRDDDGFQQVAWIDVTDVQRRWGEVAQAPAEEASPTWMEGVPPEPPRWQRWRQAVGGQ